jgi:hypothetical protein
MTNVTIQQTPQHTTFDHYPATYAIVRDALTARRGAIFQVVDLGENVTQYRTLDRRSMPPDFELSDAIRLAMVYETKRRGATPPRKRPGVPTPAKEHSIARNIRPMQLPPNRGYQRPPDTAPPMRRLMCDKLRARANRKAVA